MKIRSLIAGYVAADLFVFAVGYHVLSIREFALYFFLLAVGLPSSCVVVPLSERVAEPMAWPLASLDHVWVSVIVSAGLNVCIVLFIVWLLRIWRRKRTDDRAV